MPTTTSPGSFKAAASPSRLELLDLRSQGARTVEVLAHETGRSVATTSHHDRNDNVYVTVRYSL